MSQWKFQILPNRKDIVAHGFRMDAIGEAVEDEVNDALRYPFNFHNVNKIVVCLGRSPRSEKDYVEQLGVGQKQWSEFNLERYTLMNDEQKIEALRDVVKRTFDWLEDNFDDAGFVAIAKGNLEWAT